jgi:phage-related protein
MAGDFGKQIGRLHIRVLPNADKFRQDLRRDLQEIQKSVKLEVSASTGTDGADRDIKSFIRRWSKQVIRVRVAATTAVASKQLTVVSRDRTAKIKVQVESKGLAAAKSAIASLSGFRVANDLLQNFTNHLQDLDKKAIAIGRVSLLVANLVNVLAGAAVGAITVAGDLAKIGSLALVLPAAITGAAIGITTLTIALKSAKTELAELGPAFGGLQTIIQSNFWEQARQPILNLVNSVLPSLEGGFASTASSIGNQLGVLSVNFQRTLGGGVLQGMFQNLKASIDIVTGGMRPLAEALTTLGVVGSQYLPRLATFLVDVGTKFNDWVQKSAENGDLFLFIEEGIQALKDLARAVGGIIGILRGIDSAATAAGAGGLKSFADNLQGAAAILQSPAVQTALTTILKGVGTGLAGLGGGISSMGGVLMKLAPVIGTVLASAGQSLGAFITALSTAFAQPEFAAGLLGLFDGIYSAIMSLAPAFPALGQLFGQLASTVGIFLSALAPLLATLKMTFAPLFDAILIAIQPLIPLFAGVLADAISGLVPIVESLSATVSENEGFFTGLIGTLVVVGAGIAGVVKAFSLFKAASLGVKSALATLKTVQGGIDTARLVAMYGVDYVKAAASAVAAGGRFVASLARQGAAMVATGAKAVAYKAKTAAVGAAGLISSLARGTAALIVQGAAWTATAARAVAAKAVMLAVTTATKLAAAGQWLLNAALSANPIGIIIGLIVALVAGLVYFFTQTELGQQVWSNLTSFIGDAIANIQSFIGSVVSWIAENWQLLLGILIGPFGLLIGYIVTNFDAIKAFIGSFIAGVVAIWNAFWAGLGMIVQTYLSLVTAVITAGLAVVKGIWTAVWTGIQTILSTVWSFIVNVVTSYIALVRGVITTVLAAIKAIWSAAWTGITNVVKAIWAGIMSIVQAGIQFARTIIANVMGLIKAVWTGNWSAIGAFVQNILNAARTFIASVLGAIRGTIASVMSSVLSTWSNIWSSILNAVSSVVSGVRSFVSGLVENVRSTISGVFDTVSNIQSRIVGVFAGAGSWLAESGRKIIQGLVDGIAGMANRVKDAVGNVMSAARNLLPFSPAKEGPFSGKGWTLYSGRSISAALGQGITDNVGKVRSAALKMVEAVPTSVGTELEFGESDVQVRKNARADARQGDTYNIGNVGYDPAAIIREANMAKKQKLVRERLDGKVPIS